MIRQLSITGYTNITDTWRKKAALRGIEAEIRYCGELIVRDVTRKLYILTILTLGTQAIEIPGIPFSLFQIMIMLTGFMSVLAVLKERYYGLHQNLAFAVVELLSCGAAFSLSTFPSWAKSSLLVGIMTSMMIVFIPHFFGREDLARLERALIRSQYIAVPFSVYTYYMFYYRGGLPERIRLFLGMYITLDSDFIRRAQASGHVRLALPFATPPVLSVVMGICLVLLLMNRNLFRQEIRISLMGIFAVILGFTGSRAGVMAVAITLLLFAPKRLKRSRLKRIHVSWIFITGLLGLGILYVAAHNFAYIAKFSSRYSISFLLQDRHLLLLIECVRIWFRSLENFLFGIGFGSSIHMQGSLTNLGPYFFNSYLTLAVERGILGMYLAFSLIKMGLHALKQRKSRSADEFAMAAAAVAALASCLFYEVFHCYFFVIVIAVYYVIYNERTGKAQ
ncbi:hypothetical protein [Otoolea muris]|uniref:hypothetical protein n=1 Tax=Otoolea muris TaxID=2941515 RepID=UPI00204141DE|nr:hypothetical protein [Otoolea muris]